MPQYISQPSIMVGDSVKYFSFDLDDWISARVDSFNSDGTMNLSDRRVEARHYYRAASSIRYPEVWAL